MPRLFITIAARNTRHRFYLSVICLGALMSAVGRGQEFRGTIRGTVTDPSGAVVAGAMIRVVNDATNVPQQTQSNARGNYEVPFLLPGSYSVNVEHAGFRQSERHGIRIASQQEVTLDFVLQVGASAETVTVSGDAPLLNTASAELGQVVDRTYIEAAPVTLDRNVLDLARLAPGVSGGGGTYTSNSQKDMVISGNGSTTGRVEFFVDGIPSTVPASGGYVGFVPSMDSVEDMKVQTTLFDAAYGHSNGGAISVTTRGGTNQLHGAVYDYKRFSSLNANSWTNNRLGIARPAVHYNQWGYTVGGPVFIPHLYDGRNKTFFMTSLESNADHAASSRLGRVPTALERTGDFSQTLNSLGGPLAIYDPLTTVVSAGKATRSMFPGNRIPASRLDPTGLSVLAQYPLPNIGGATQIGANNWGWAGTETVNEKQFSIRVDHEITTNNRLFVRVSQLARDQIPNRPFPTEYREGGGGDLIHRFFPSVGIDDTFTITPTLIGSVRYGFTRRSEYTSKGQYGVSAPSLDLAPSLFNSQYLKTYPIFRLGENLPMVGSGYRPDANELQSLISNFTKITGAHSIKFGIDYRLARRNPTALGTTAPGDFTFNQVFTQADPFTRTSGDVSGTAMADLLLGTATSGALGFTSPLSLQNHLIAGYVQEDWKVSRKLTLNFGLRYELETPYTERYNRVSYGFDSSAKLPLQVPGLDLKGGVLFAGVNGSPRQEGKIDWNNFGPRFGFAFSVNPKTVIRGGYGLFYSGQTYNSDFNGAEGDFSASTSYVGSLDNGATVFTTLRNPFPNGVRQPSGSAAELLSQVGDSLTYYDTNRVSPYNQQRQISVARQLPGDIVFEVSYLGMLTVKELQAYNLNQIPDRYLALGAAQNNQVKNPFFGIFPNTSALGQGATIAQRQLWVAYPQFTTLTVQGANTGRATYNALQLKAEKRFSHGYNFIWHYVHSRLMSTNDSFSSLVNPRNYRSVSQYDQPNVMKLVFTYQSPLHITGSQWSHRLAEGVVGGWTVGGLLTLAEGAPLSITQANGRPLRLRNAAKTGSIEARLGDNKDAAGRITNAYFDTSAFAPLASQYVIPPEPPYFDELRAPGTRSLNLSLAKAFPIRERLRLQVRAEAIGVTNTPNFDAPGVNMSNASTFGVISSAGGSRTMQVSARAVF